MEKWTLGALVALSLLRTAGAQVINGGFELPNSSGSNQVISGGDSLAITGWTTTNNGVERFDPAIYGIGSAFEGSLIVDLAPFTFTGGGIQQTFPTVAGQSYVLSFVGGTSNAFGRTGTAVIDVTVGSSFQSFTLTNLQTLVTWTTYAIPFTATAATTTVLFENTQDANTHFAFIDAVSLGSSVAPEPSTLGLLALAPLLSVAGRRRCRRAQK